MKEFNPVSIPVVQVRPNMLVIYPYTIWPNGKPNFKRHGLASIVYSKQENQDQNFQGKTAYSGQLTEHSRKRLQKCINLLVAIAEPKRILPPMVKKAFTFKVNFVTLTLPSAQGVVSDKDIKKTCLDPWIKAMKRKHQLKSYVWRAERQFNGNIHFHITTDTYIPQDDLRNDWNRQLSKFHFIDDFRAKHQYSTPNSTDVHAVWKISNIAGYMVKYMSKDPETHLKEVNAKRLAKGKDLIIPENHEFRSVPGQPSWDTPIDGKVWDCSQNLKAKDRCETEADTEIRQEVNELVQKRSLRFVNTDHCTIIFAGGFSMETILEGYLLQIYRDYLYRVKNYDTLQIQRKEQKERDLLAAAMFVDPEPDPAPWLPYQIPLFQSA